MDGKEVTLLSAEGFTINVTFAAGAMPGTTVIGRVDVGDGNDYVGVRLRMKQGRWGLLRE